MQVVRLVKKYLKTIEWSKHRTISFKFYLFLAFLYIKCTFNNSKNTHVKIYVHTRRWTLISHRSGYCLDFSYDLKWNLLRLTNQIMFYYICHVYHLIFFVSWNLAIIHLFKLNIRLIGYKVIHSFSVERSNKFAVSF